MIEIQSNVKLLTVEKDKLSVLYEQVNKYNLDPEQYITVKICSLIKKKLDLLNYCKLQFKMRKEECECRTKQLYGYWIMIYPMTHILLSMKGIVIT